MAFRFFDLPGEIRRQIYCQLLINQGDRDMPIGSICQGKGPQQTVEPAVLRVCKQMHDETARILYGQNEFYIYVDFYRFNQFLLLIGKVNAALIRKICLCCLDKLRGLYDELPAAISLSRGPLQCLEKITIVHSRHSPPNHRPERNRLFQSDVLHVCTQVAEQFNLVVLDEGGLEDGPKTQITTRFAVPGELQHQTKVRAFERSLCSRNAGRNPVADFRQDRVVEVTIGVASVKSED